jgi:hypothetical protein
MRTILAVALAFLPVGAPPSFPAERPWIVLVHDAGLADDKRGGLVVAMWTNGVVVRERLPECRSSGCIEVGQVDAETVRQVERLVSDSGLWDRASAPRYLDLPEDGLVMRIGPDAKCWFDTPGEALTPGLRQLADAILALRLSKAVRSRISQKQWLPWSHFREPLCR